MISVVVTDFATWRDRARALLRAKVPPDEVVWSDGRQESLIAVADPVASSSASGNVAEKAPRVPAHFLEKAELAADHRSDDRFAILYRLLWKVTHGAQEAVDDPLDPDGARLTSMLRDVRKEEHDMQAFVRFRRTLADDGTEHWVAWYRPAHPVLERVARFFVRRYPTMPWTLFTPERSADWDGESLRFGPGAPRETAPAPDDLDALFLDYYAHVFNPARTNVTLLHRHLPSRIRSQLPESALIESLVRDSASRVVAMQAPRVSASEALLPAERDLASLARAAAGCRACPIGARATQTVFGEGSPRARLMIVGEQPGDEEDLTGRPFVGPAGRLLDQLMARAGLSRDAAYLTNTVKHFKWEPRGKRRMHSRPLRDEIDACRGWLFAEIAALQPAMILCLGATAAQTFCGPKFRVQRDRGKPQSTPWAPWWMATYHPSALLRASDEAGRRSMEGAMVADLELARDHLASLDEARHLR